MTKEKVKAWFKENWMYVAGGVTTVGVIALAVVKGLKPDESVGNLMVIDLDKDDWPDKLTTPCVFHGKHMTVRQADSAFHLENYITSNMRSKGLLTDQLDSDLCNEFCEKFPHDAAVLEALEGFFKPMEEAEKTA